MKMPSHLNVVPIQLLYIFNTVTLCEDEMDEALTLVIRPLGVLHECTVY